MATICPKCSADTDALEEEVDDEGLCIHEKVMIGGVALIAVAGVLFGTGVVYKKTRENFSSEVKN